MINVMSMADDSDHKIAAARSATRRSNRRKVKVASGHTTTVIDERCDQGEIRLILEKDIARTANEVAELADHVTKSLLVMIAQGCAERLDDITSLRKALFSAICQEIMIEIGQKISDQSATEVLK